MVKALVVGQEPSCAAVRAALAEVGCIGTKTVSFDGAIAHVASNRDALDLLVVHLVESDIERLHRLTRSHHNPPVLVICEERHIEAVQLAGASGCAITPVRQRELVGRIRWMLHDRNLVRTREQRERLKSDKIVALKREKEDVERLACVDSLTGFANRRHAVGLLEKEWNRSIRERLSLGLVMIDLDCYHAYNEQYGHLAGDACLQRVCDAMGKCLGRPADFMGRYGGEEFIAVLPSTDANGAGVVAERLRSAVEALALPHAGSLCAPVVTITAGFSSLRAFPGPTVRNLIELADAALLRAKSKGRNRIEGEAPRVTLSGRSAHRSRQVTPFHADPWFVDRIPAFLLEARDGTRALLQELGNDGATAIKATTQQLRATARALGMLRLDKLVESLQCRALAGDRRATVEAADVLIEYVTNLHVIYRRATTPSHLSGSVDAIGSAENR